MFRKFALTVFSVACLGLVIGFTGCGGPGEAETITEDQRPQGLSSGAGEEPKDDSDVPENLSSTR